MQPPQWPSLVVYLTSAAIFTAAALLCSRWGRWLRGLVLGFVYTAILLVAALELPITRLPFWSRDFSLTWTLLVVASATALACLRPGMVASRGKESVIRDGSYPISSAVPGELPAATSGGGSPPGHRSPADRMAELSSWRPKPSLRWVLFAVAVGVGLVSLYVYGAQQNLVRVNTDPSQRDQNAYIGHAEDLLNEDYSHVSGRNRMPLYPFILSFGLNPSDPREVAFFRAKEFSLALSLVLLGLLGVLFFRLLTPVEAGTLWLITAFTVYVFRAAYVQPELLYYTLTALLFVLMLRHIRQPGLGLAAIIGILAGLTHLTKASILPGLAAFLLVALAWGIARSIREGNGTGGRSSALVRLACDLAIVVGFFLLTVFPYIKNSWYIYGRPFYNVNSTFYMWYDSWREAELGTKAHGDRNGWPDMPPDEIPSLPKYIREHSPAEILGRLLDGVSLTIREAVDSYGYAKYVLLLGLALVAASALNPRALEDALRRHQQSVVFVCLFFGAYVLLYAWFAQIAGGIRLALALLVPLLLTLAYGIRLVLRDRTVRRLGRTLRLLDLVYALLLIVVILDIWSVVTDRVLTTFAGS